MEIIQAEAFSPGAVDMLRDGGRLCGIFSKALGISCGGAAVTVQTESIMSTCSIAASGIFSKGISWPLNAEVVLRDNCLLVGDAAGIMLADAVCRGNMTISALPQLTENQLSSALNAVRQQLNRHRRETGFSVILGSLGWAEDQSSEIPVLYKRAFAAVMLLRRGCMLSDLPVIAEAHMNLVGLGAGLTPSGDDFLTGFWAALMMRADRISFTAAAVENLQGLLNRTTIYGRSELIALSKGLCSEPLCKVLRSLEGNPATALESLAVIGGSTGIDTILGIAEALRIIHNF